MKTEKELFLYELKGHRYEFRNTDWYDDWERFEDDQLNMVWEMWQAATSRDGYKLVPVEPSETMSDAGLNCEHDIDDFVVINEIYKAMIGAAE